MIAATFSPHILFKVNDVHYPASFKLSRGGAPDMQNCRQPKFYKVNYTMSLHSNISRKPLGCFLALK